jgi:hypothetical protein
MDIDDGYGLLEELGKQFVTALQLKEAGRLDRAEDELRAILRVEPRLPSRGWSSRGSSSTPIGSTTPRTRPARPSTRSSRAARGRRRCPSTR